MPPVVLYWTFRRGWRGNDSRKGSSMNDILQDPRFAGIKPFPSKLWLSSPTMHGEEQKWVDEAIHLPGDEPNYWLSCLLIDAAAMAPQVRGERDHLHLRSRQVLPDRNPRRAFRLQRRRTTPLEAHAPATHLPHESIRHRRLFRRRGRPLRPRPLPPLRQQDDARPAGHGHRHHPPLLPVSFVPR